MQSSRLPLPSFKSSGNDDDQKVNQSNESVNNGRVRSYPHSKNQWTTFVYCQISNEEICHLTDLINPYQPKIKLIDDVHLSLHRDHYALNFHQINPFISMLRDKLSNYQAFDVYLTTVKLFNNQELTRSFICLCQPNLFIDSVNTRTARNVFEIIKQTLDLFHAKVKLPQIVKNQQKSDNDGVSDGNEFIFHTSLAWCLHEHKEEAKQLVNQLDDFIDEPIKVHINEIKINTGNICHTIILKEK